MTAANHFQQLWPKRLFPAVTWTTRHSVQIQCHHMWWVTHFNTTVPTHYFYKSTNGFTVWVAIVPKNLIVTVTSKKAMFSGVIYCILSGSEILQQTTQLQSLLIEGTSQALMHYMICVIWLKKNIFANLWKWSGWIQGQGSLRRQMNILATLTMYGCHGPWVDFYCIGLGWNPSFRYSSHPHRGSRRSQTDGPSDWWAFGPNCENENCGISLCLMEIDLSQLF